MASDGGGARTVQPEFLARLRAHGDEAFAALAVGQADHLRGGARHGIVVVTDDVADQHHLREGVALALGSVADRAQVALVQVLQASQDGAAGLLGLGVEVVLDLDDARDRVARLAEELQAHGAGRLGHAVQDPARAGDDAVAAFLLHAGQTGQELVGDVLAQTFLAEGAAFDGECLGAQQLGADRRIAVEPLQLERDDGRVVDLAEVMVQALDFQPVAVRIDHAPPGQVVQRGAPQHGLLAARVHGDVAADARGVDRGRVHGEDEAGFLSRFRHAARHHAGARVDGRHGVVDARQVGLFDRIQALELFRVDDGRERRERHGAAGVAGAASARDDGQAQLEAALDDAGDLFFRIRREHHERVLDAPVGGVGDVRHARQAVELDVVLGGHAAEHLLGAAAQVVDLGEFVLEGLDGAARVRDQLLDPAGALVALRVVVRGLVGSAALLDLRQAVIERVDQHLPALGVVEQVVLQVRVAAHHPDVAQHFVQHPRGAAGAAFAAQLVEDLPCGFAQQTDDDFPIRERGVVIGNLAQPWRGVLGREFGVDQQWGIHGEPQEGRGRDGRQSRPRGHLKGNCTARCRLDALQQRYPCTGHGRQNRSVFNGLRQCRPVDSHKKSCKNHIRRFLIHPKMPCQKRSGRVSSAVVMTR